MRSSICQYVVGAGLWVVASFTTADTLSDIYKLALDNDARYKASEATYGANLEVEKQALSAILPQIRANGGYSEKNMDVSANQVFEFGGASFNSVTDDEVDSDTTTYGLTLNQPILDLPAWFGYKSGKEVSRLAHAQFVVDQQDLIIRVANAYFEVLRTQDNLEVSKAEERASKRRLEHANQRFDAGVIAITDVLEARAAYDLTVVSRLTDEGDVETSYEALTVLTGQSHVNLSQLHIDFPVTDPAPAERNDWVDLALKTSFVLKAADYRMVAARYNAKAKKMRHAPKITGFYSYNDSDEEGDSTSHLAALNKPFDLESDGSVWGVKLDIPLYSGGRISSERRQAYKQYNAALQRQIDTRRTVVQSARALHIAVVTDVQRVKARAQAIVSSSSALDATQAGYQAETRNIVDVLQAQRTLYSSIRNYANSRYDYVLDLLKLKQAAGVLDIDDVDKLNKWMVELAASPGSQYKKYFKD